MARSAERLCETSIKTKWKSETRLRKDRAMVTTIAAIISTALVLILTSAVFASTAMAVSYGAQIVSSSVKSALCASVIFSCAEPSKPVIEDDKLKGV